MGLETATFINQLVATNPVGATDPKAQGDDHLKLIKSVLQASFPNIGGAVTATHTQINNAALSGLTGFAVPSNAVKPSGAAAGAATTALRSDVQLILDTAEDWSWSGLHTFSGGLTISVDAGDAGPKLIHTAADSNEKIWQVAANNIGQLVFTTRTDADELGTSYLIINRNGSSVDAIIAAATTIDLIGELVAGDDGTTGYTKLARSGTSPGYLELYGSDDVRRGYFGSSDGANNVEFGGSNGWNVKLTSNFVAATDKVIDTTTRGTLKDGGSAVIDIPVNTSGTIKPGECLVIGSGITINTSDLNAGRVFSVYNESDVNVTITQGAGVTLRLAGTTSAGNRTLAPRGIATFWCRTAAIVLATGNIT